MDISSVVAAYLLDDNWVVSFISWVHEQPIVAQNIIADDTRLNVGYHEIPFEGSS